MIRLLPGQTLQAVLAGAVATLQPQATAFFSDQSASGYVGGNQLTLLNGVADVDVVAAPAASTTRDIDQLQIFNRDTAPITVTVKVDVGGADSPILTVTLQTLETLAYAHADGWESLDANGRVKTSAFGSSQIPVQFQDEGVNLGSSGTVDTLNFTGPGITASRAGSIITANVPVADSFRNKIIGGNFGTNPWQRGVAFPAVASGAYIADRWQLINTSAGVVRFDKEAFAPTVAQAGRLVTHNLAMTVTTPDVAVAPGDAVVVTHRIEGYNFQALAQRPMVLSFWHAHSKLGVYCVAFGNSGSDRTLVVEYTQAAAANWEYTSIVIPPSPAAGTWNYVNGLGMAIYFTVMSGSTYQTAPGIWQTGSFFATANQVNGMDAANNFRLDLVQLESGTVATPFESRSFQEELELCQRYYEKSYDLAVVPGTLNGSQFEASNLSAISATNWRTGQISYKTRKRAVPTITPYVYGLANTTGSWTSFSTVSVPTNRGVTVVAPAECGFSLDANTGGDLYILGHWTADAEL